MIGGVEGGPDLRYGEESQVWAVDARLGDRELYPDSRSLTRLRCAEFPLESKKLGTNIRNGSQILRFFALDIQVPEPIAPLTSSQMMAFAGGLSRKNKLL